MSDFITENIVVSTAPATAYLLLNTDSNSKSSSSNDPMSGSIIEAATTSAAAYLPLNTYINSIPTKSEGLKTLPAGITSPRPVQSRPTHSSNPIQIGSTNESGYTVSNGILYLDRTSFTIARPTTAKLNNNTVISIGPNGAVSVNVTNQTSNLHTSPEGISPQKYLVGAFIPTVLAVLFTIPWHILASSIKEIEPFYQLQRADGASAANSLALDYRSSINVVATVNAMRKGHCLVWLSGLTALVVLIIPPLASETVFIGFSGHCTSTSGRHACSPQLNVYPVTARLIQGILAFIAIVTLALAVAIQRRKSGIYANPFSIAGMATLFQDQSLIELFQGLNPYAVEPRTLTAALQGHRYRIGSYQQTGNGGDYGMMICQSNDLPQETDVRASFQEGKRYAALTVTTDDEDRFSGRPKPRLTSAALLISPGSVVVFALLIFGLGILVVYYNQTGGDTGFERFMDSDTFGVKFLFTAVGVAVKMYWTVLDDGKSRGLFFSFRKVEVVNMPLETRQMEPYRQLLRGDAPASDSILLAPQSNLFTSIVCSLKNSHFLNAYISFVAILCEPLTVALVNIPFNPGLARITYRTATYVTIAVLSMMLIGAVSVLYRKPTPNSVLRRPETLAGMMIALCGSHILEDFRGMAKLEERERDATIRGWGKYYAMGSVKGVDGVEREGIDDQTFVKTA